MELSLREQERVRRAGQGVPVYPVRTVTASETLRESDAFILVDATAGAVTLTLPKAAYMKGRMLWIKLIDTSTNGVTVEGDGTETIDDALNMNWTTAYASYTYLCDGTEYWIV